MDLQEPTRKMSTTGGTEQGTVRLLDDPDVIRKKFRSAVTDSGREIRRGDDKPGVSNLIDILAVATQRTPEDDRGGVRGLAATASSSATSARPSSSCSTRSGSATSSSAPTRPELLRLLAVGADKARAASAPTLEAMYERMGFVRLEAHRP